MKIGCKKISNGESCASAEGSCKLNTVHNADYGKYDLISTMIMEIIKLSFVSRVPCKQKIRFQEPMSARNMQVAMRFYKKYNRHILE